MQTCVLKVPLGPELVLYQSEFYAITRHRIMLFFYFGLVCMILVVSMDGHGTRTKPELVLGLAAIEVLIGLIVLILCKRIAVWRATRTNRIPYVHLGWILVAMVTGSVASSEFLEPFLFGTPRSTLFAFALKLAFYLTLTELLTSIVIQNCAAYILADLRRDQVPHGPAAFATVPEQRV